MADEYTDGEMPPLPEEGGEDRDAPTEAELDETAEADLDAWHDEQYPSEGSWVWLLKERSELRGVGRAGEEESGGGTQGPVDRGPDINSRIVPGSVISGPGARPTVDNSTDSADIVPQHPREKTT